MAARRASQLLCLGVGSAALVSIPAMTGNFKVYAADHHKSRGNFVKITELSLYDNPEDRVQFHFEPEKISQFRKAISIAREAVWDYLDTVQESTDKLKEKLEIGKAHTEGFISYLQNDPGVLPRATLITVAGLGGIVAGYRGGVMRKIFYSATAMTATTALCYPKETVALTTNVYNNTMDSVKTWWAGVGPQNGGKPSMWRSTFANANNNHQKQPIIGGRPLKGDLGQSKEEDKDLYTTRGS